ncbi:SDR family NAD(P)-dependent oxidoreductase [Nocardia nepalensis]|uniref:SDR family NAD(P)-dependent oxidoreductase n=1 Tax=Nocardia nepalensis TaxID=3375448 RepID=UPI003B682083
MTRRNATGRVAVVTGGAAGIGQAFAERLPEEGHAVAVADVGPADETLRRIEKAGGQGFTAHCDSPESVRAFAAEVEVELGQVDVLVNNAGVYPAAAFIGMNWAEWQRVRTATTESGPAAQSRGFAQLGLGTGAFWDLIAAMGGPRRTPNAASAQD